MTFTIVCVLFDANEDSQIPERSRVYSPKWVDILWRMCDRNLTREWRLVCLTHYPKESFHEDVVVVPFLEDTRQVMCLTEVFRPDLGIEHGMFVALDTVITRNIDSFADYRGVFALPRFKKKKAALAYDNPIALFSREGARELWNGRDRAFHDKEMVMEEFGPSEMRYWSKYAPEGTDDVHELWPKQVVPFDAIMLSEERGLYRKDERQGTVEELKEAVRILYFFGKLKQHNTKLQIAIDHWK
ncbi:hypothetical protein KKF61_09065 [Patescibacteria group bacterium]|nr:hypothetical protein [Patescibacteria group bacterium]